MRLWGVLWLEVAGVVFGLFVLFAATGVWRLRGEWRSNAPEHRQLLGALAMLAVFGYFCGQQLCAGAAAGTAALGISPFLR